MASTLPGTDRLACLFIVPEATTNLGNVLPRWTQSHLSAPAIIITPNPEDDIVAAIRLAKENDLNIVPGGGGHDTFTTIDNKTAYLDLKNFNDIQLDQASSTVRLQAGVADGELASNTKVGEWSNTLRGRLAAEYLTRRDKTNFDYNAFSTFWDDEIGDGDPDSPDSYPRTRRYPILPIG